MRLMRWIADAFSWAQIALYILGLFAFAAGLIWVMWRGDPFTAVAIVVIGAPLAWVIWNG